jgi:branched-chain amino acid transport system ATP-binding protein
MLEVAGLEVRYGAIRAVRGVSLGVGKGELVTILGANGAGKSSTLMCIAGALQAAEGTIRLRDEDVTAASPESMVRRGVATVPETRGIFSDLTVAENLRLGAYVRRREASAVAETRDTMLAMFPRLAERAAQPAGTLSGGEQQMLVIARAMMSGPSILLLDEPSLGLAPTVVDQIFGMIAELKRSGLTILLVEQNAAKALAVADRAYVMRLGRIAAAGTAAEIRAATDLHALYLGG